MDLGGLSATGLLTAYHRSRKFGAGSKLFALTLLYAVIGLIRGRSAALRPIGLHRGVV